MGVQESLPTGNPFGTIQNHFMDLKLPHLPLVT
jgi:hypothetical protein